MRTSMDRKYPILVDIGAQIEQHPDTNYVFFYDDGAVYRAFVCDTINVKENIVDVFRNGQLIITIPSDTVWRMVHRSGLEFVLGSEMEATELNNMKQKRDLQKQLVKDLGLDDQNQSSVAHEYQAGMNPKVYL